MYPEHAVDRSRELYIRLGGGDKPGADFAHKFRAQARAAFAQPLLLLLNRLLPKKGKKFGYTPCFSKTFSKTYEKSM